MKITLELLVSMIREKMIEDNIDFITASGKIERMFVKGLKNRREMEKFERIMSMLRLAQEFTDKNDFVNSYMAIANVKEALGEI